MTWQTLFSELTDPGTCQWLFTAILHFLWQGTLLALLAVLVRRSVRTAAVRYNILLILFVILAGCVPVNLTLTRRPSLVPQVVAVQALPGTDAPQGPTTREPGQFQVAGPLQGAPASAAEAAQSPEAESAPATVVPSSVATSDRSGRRSAVVARWSVLVWMAGAALMLLRLLIAVLGGWRLSHTARPADAALMDLAARAAKRLGMTSPPAIALTHRVSVPVVAGILRPLILVPPSIMTGLTPTQVQAILIHELGHIRRLDTLVNLAQRVLESLLFFHPATWFLSRELRRERENCCDDLVLGTGTHEVTYADALLRMAEVRSANVSASMTVAVTGRGGSELRRRVLRLISPEPAVRPTGAILTAMLCVLVFGSQFLKAQDEQDSTDSSAGLPDDLVAVLGEDRARVWGHSAHVSVTQDHSTAWLTESLGYVSEFDTTTLKRTFQFRPHKVRCLDSALVKSDTRLLTISVDGTARLWDITVRPPRELDRYVAFDGTEKAGWLSMNVAYEGNRAVVRSDDRLALFDLSKDTFRPLESPPVRGGVPFRYALSPDGRWLVTCEDQQTSDLIQAEGGMAYGYRDAVLPVWDLTGEKPRLASELKRKTLDQLEFLGNDQLVGCDPYFIPKRATHVWSLKGGKLTAGDDLPKAAQTFTNYVTSPDGTLLAFGSGTTMEVYRRQASGWKPLASLATGANASCSFAGDKALIVASIPEVQRWELANDRFTRLPGPKGHTDAVMGLMFDARTNSVLTAATDAIREWSLEDTTGQNELGSSALDYSDVGKMWPWGEGKGFLLKRSINGAEVIEGVRRSGNRMLSRFKLNNGDSYRTSAWCATMHPTKNLLATGHWDHKVRIWDVSGRSPQKLMEWTAHQGHVCDLAFSPDGGKIVTVGWDRLTNLWTIPEFAAGVTPVSQKLGQHEDVVRSVAWSPTGSHIASGGEDGQILLWDIAAGGEPMSLTQPEDGPARKNSLDSKTVDTLEFSKDGSRLLSGDGKGRLTVWKTEDQTILKRWQLSGWIWDARFSPDEQLIGTANYDGTAYLLKAPSKD